MGHCWDEVERGAGSKGLCRAITCNKPMETGHVPGHGAFTLGVAGNMSQDTALPSGFQCSVTVAGSLLGP